MISNKVLLGKYRQDTTGPGPHYCDCGSMLRENETVALYPQPDEVLNNLGVDLREVVCLTCHFWFCHQVMSELGR